MGRSLSLPINFQAWIDIAGRINCPAPLPEDEETPVLTKMLFPAPYDVPEKKAKKTANGGRSGILRKGALDVSSEDETDSSVAEDDGEEEEESGFPQEGGKKKREAPTNLEAKAPKRGKGSLTDNSAWDVKSSPERMPRIKPRAAS